MSIRATWNSVPGAYRSRDAAKVSQSVILGPGQPGRVVIPSLITWLSSTSRRRRRSVDGDAPAALVRFLDDRLRADPHLGDHQQPEVPDEQRRQVVVGDLPTRNVQPETLGAQPAAVGEAHLRVELCPPLLTHPETRPCQSPPVKIYFPPPTASGMRGVPSAQDPHNIRESAAPALRKQQLPRSCVDLAAGWSRARAGVVRTWAEACAARVRAWGCGPWGCGAWWVWAVGVRAVGGAAWGCC